MSDPIQTDTPAPMYPPAPPNHHAMFPPAEQPDNQDELIKFIKDPETIRKAVEGSMDRRIAKLDEPDTLDEILFDVFSYATAANIPTSKKAKAKAAIRQYALKERIDTATQLLEASEIQNLPFHTLAKQYIEKLEAQLTHIEEEK